MRYPLELALRLFSRSNQHNYIQGLEEEYWEVGGLKIFLKGEGESKKGVISKGGENDK